jgi:hypothetical protein
MFCIVDSFFNPMCVSESTFLPLAGAAPAALDVDAAIAI